ncbi:telomere length regulation protein [Emydomyces testavorans]|uniref:Small ribosomal subunit protein mS41 n=1 Tax=Emydomyces testavorans TaxID=2070801 RepID=A0AAF0DNR6_9EURO|nr:telomere length regulation protein [Emydomyces testavorans]
MATSKSVLTSFFLFRFPRISHTSHQCVRQLHKTVRRGFIPPPTPFVPDTQTFLTLIGRNMSQYSSKLSSWEQLFTISSRELRDMGVEPARQRRYLLRWIDKFRRGDYGVGGDLDHVTDGIAEVRAVEVPWQPLDSAVQKTSDDDAGQPSWSLAGTATTSPGNKWVVVNLPVGETKFKSETIPVKRYSQIKLHRGNKIKGPYLKLLPGANGTAARITVQEGMWEHKLGRKIDGGERRQAEVRAKRRIAESKK